MDTLLAKENPSKPLKTKVSASKSKQPLAEVNANVKQGGQAIEEIYQKKSQLEHILLRPDTYIGSIERVSQQLWVYDMASSQMVNRTVSYVPGLYKIFDEILVNAADNLQRDSSMNTLKVTIDVEENSISVLNNGKGIPIEIHQEEQCYVPELIFGHLLTSSNYNDQQKKVTGGRNGYGAKLANIFSTEFIVETADSGRKKKYKQTWRNNMSECKEPKIGPLSSPSDYTKVTFKPDLEKFGMDKLDDDIICLLAKRVVDVAGCNSALKVSLNGERIPIKSFQQYCEMFLKSTGEDRPIIFEKQGRWEVCVSTSDIGFQNTSFVNSIWTMKGGKHVDHVGDQVVKHLQEIAKKKSKSDVKAHEIKSQMWLFVKCLIENPAFDSQTKENMTLKVSAFGSKCELTTDFLKKVSKSGIVDSILAHHRVKESQQLKKTDGKKSSKVLGIPKLDDANDAGTRKGEDCTLILTEGDSAKSLAVAGLSVVGRDKYGVFPLRGKLLNVREASMKQVGDNAEVNNIKKILGLQHGKKYTSAKELRYGHVMIMTDQDQDGSHIKGLVINMFHHFWPNLVQLPGFLTEFITPIVKASKGKQEHAFYTMPEYEQWKESLGNSLKGWKIKYYKTLRTPISNVKPTNSVDCVLCACSGGLTVLKGLGTSDTKEAKEYFSNIGRHQLDFEYEDDKDDDAIDLAFSKKRVEDRKQWLSQFEHGTYFDHSEDALTYSQFVNKELILFSMSDNIRSIPSMVDGLKPGQRKILFSCFKRKLRSEIKVAQLSGYVSEQSCYHHGEQSLATTIVGMAQSFVGSNNINLLLPNGQFGTRLQGGKDAASPRYIFTQLNKITRYLFREEDDPVLEYQSEEGQSIEPIWYMPILPMVLVNGSDGIGTGWSSSVPNHNPRDIVDNLKRLLRGDDIVPMSPWYKGFSGEIEWNEKAKNYTVRGKIEQTGPTSVKITELPVRKWTQDYKEFLESLIPAEVNKSGFHIKEFKEYHTEESVDFEVTLDEANMNLVLQEGLEKKFKVHSSVSNSNMNLFKSTGQIHRFESAEDILQSFYTLRLKYYNLRKDWMVDKMEKELNILDNKVRFILAVVNGDIKVSNRRKAELVQELVKKGFEAVVKAKGEEQQQEPEDEEDNSMEEDAAVDGKRFDYLLGMPLWNLTKEKVEKLVQERDQKQEVLDTLKATPVRELWENDLDEFLEALEEMESDEAKSRTGVPKARKTGKVTKKAPSKKLVQTKLQTVKKPAAETTKAEKAASLTPEDRAEHSDLDISNSEDEALPLAERIKKNASRPAVSKTSKSTKAPIQRHVEDADKEPLVAKKQAAMKRPVIVSDTDDSCSEESRPPSKRVTVRQSGRPKKVKTQEPLSSDFDSDSEISFSESEDSGSDFEATLSKAPKATAKKAVKSIPVVTAPAPKPKPKPRAKAAPKPKAAPKKTNSTSKPTKVVPLPPSDVSPDKKKRRTKNIKQSDSEESDSSPEIDAQPSRARPSRRTAAPVKYVDNVVISDDSEEEFSEEDSDESFDLS